VIEYVEVEIAIALALTEYAEVEIAIALNLIEIAPAQIEFVVVENAIALTQI